MRRSQLQRFQMVGAARDLRCGGRAHLAKWSLYDRADVSQTVALGR